MTAGSRPLRVCVGSERKPILLNTSVVFVKLFCKKLLNKWLFMSSESVEALNAYFTVARPFMAVAAIYYNLSSLSFL